MICQCSASEWVEFVRQYMIHVSLSLQSHSLTCPSYCSLAYCREGNVSLLCDCFSNWICTSTSCEKCNSSGFLFQLSSASLFLSCAPADHTVAHSSLAPLTKWTDHSCSRSGRSLCMHMYSISTRSWWLTQGQGKTWGVSRNSFPSVVGTIGFHWGWFLLSVKLQTGYVGYRTSSELTAIKKSWVVSGCTFSFEQTVTLIALVF